MDGASVIRRLCQGARHSANPRPHVHGRRRPAEGTQRRDDWRGVWHERFGGRSDVLGQTIRLNSRQFTIDRRAAGERRVPGRRAALDAQQGDPNAVDNYSWKAPDGSSLESRWHRAAPICCVRINRSSTGATRRRTSRRSCAICASTSRRLRHDRLHARRSGVVAALVACANVAAMMLARALARRREMGIRLAIGASRARLLRQLLVENLMLSASGGAPRTRDRQLGDPAVARVAARPGAAMGVVHARCADGDLHARHVHRHRRALRLGAGTACDERRPARAPSASTAGSTPQSAVDAHCGALVVAEFALASLMFVCGGLLVRAYDRVRNVDPGFDPNGVMTFTVSLPGSEVRRRPRSACRSSSGSKRACASCRV